MKKLFLIATLLFLFESVNAQKVYQTSIKKEADKKVYVTDIKSEANMLVFETSTKTEAKPYSGLWFWTKIKSEANWKIYFTKIKSEADLKIYFTKIKSEAGPK